MSDFSNTFPYLNDDNHKKTSPVTDEYNCIAWAAEENDCWWWPGPEPVTYWPPGVPRVETVEAFISAFGLLNYEVCDSGDIEDGFEKVVLYVHNNKPTHMARQLRDGTWTSKLGRNIDINHFTLEAISGPFYGQAEIFLRRKCSI